MDRLVCISTGIVAPATANAGGASELESWLLINSPMVLKYVGARWRLLFLATTRSNLDLSLLL